ncbi:MAG: hypothetical protein AAGF33_02990 [Pseudomonadota bacterium]
MAYNLAMLTYTPDLRYVDPPRMRLVSALRYSHVARARNCYSPQKLGDHLGSRTAVSSFHVFLDEAGRAWPEPISLNPPCQPAFSYDEMLLADLCIAAARNDRKPFDEMTQDMLGQAARNSIWASARRLMRYLVSVVE